MSAMRSEQECNAVSRIEYNILINAKDNTVNVDIYERKGMVSGYKTK